MLMRTVLTRLGKQVLVEELVDSKIFVTVTVNI